MRLLRLGAAAMVVVWTIGCGRGDLTPIAQSVEQILSAKPIAPVTGAAWADARAFYANRSHMPAWVTSKSVSKAGAQAIRVLQTGHTHGLRSGSADAAVRAAHDRVEKLADDSTDRAAALAAFDVQVTSALLQVGRDVALGRTQPRAVDSRWKPRRAAPDFVASLAQAIDGDLSGWLASLAPRHPEYAALQNALAALYVQQEKGGWPSVPRAAFAAGRKHPAVAQLRQRLAASGELHPSVAQGSTIYDAAVRDGVRRFQERHRLTADGIAGAPTIAAMNVSIERRIQQIEMNLDRWRWLPDDLGQAHLLVNIPSYTLFIREQGRTVNDIRVVVGEPDNATPIFSERMETVVFSPYWNIPDTIAADETAPAIAQDENYLRRNNIEILRVSGSRTEHVDPADVDWNDPEELRRLAFRQRPGPSNALGHVKFLFPNPYNVYLHDTPADNLFRRPGRAFSHGCVRVEEPEALARYVLRDQPEWTSARITEAMHAGTEKHVKLPTPLPVHLVYFTAWADASGAVSFFPDIYGHDGRQAAALAKR